MMQNLRQGVYGPAEHIHFCPASGQVADDYVVAQHPQGWKERSGSSAGTHNPDLLPGYGGGAMQPDPKRGRESTVQDEVRNLRQETETHQKRSQEQRLILGRLSR